MDDDIADIDMGFDHKSRPYTIIHGTRNDYLDYTGILSDPSLALLDFVVVADRAARKQCYVVRNHWIDRQNGSVQFPANICPKLKTKDFQNFFDSALEDNITAATIDYIFREKTYKVVWKKVSLKAVFADFRKWTYNYVSLPPLPAITLIIYFSNITATFEAASDYILDEGSIARDCDTLPDIDMAKKQIADLQQKRPTKPIERLSDNIKYISRIYVYMHEIRAHCRSYIFKNYENIVGKEIKNVFLSIWKKNHAKNQIKFK